MIKCPLIEHRGEERRGEERRGEEGRGEEKRGEPEGEAVFMPTKSLHVITGV